MIQLQAGPDCESPQHPEVRRERLSGNLARRKFSAGGYIWDDELIGFAFRHTASGGKTWVVQYRHRGDTRRVAVGSFPAMKAVEARRKARHILAGASLDGLPTRLRMSSPDAGMSFAQYVPVFWTHYARHWKSSTQRTNRAYIRNHFIPAFGERIISSLIQPDIVAWRDTMTRKEGAFNRAIPILSVMLGYAEILGYRPRGSNPCKGISRYKRRVKERFLSAREYQRLGAVLHAQSATMPIETAAIWLLIYLGARKGEILGLRWEWIGEAYIDLPDSKTGPKRLYLNRQAAIILSGLTRQSSGRVLGDAFRPRHLDNAWVEIRSVAGIPDVRLHDLRHSFASVAIGHGISLSKLGGLLGHALPETTVRYAHLADDTIGEAASRISGSMARVLGLVS